MKNFKQNRIGFTIVEILIAFAVIGLIFSLIMPVLSYSKQASNTMNKLDVYHDARRVDQEVFDELKFSSGILYPPLDDSGSGNDWYPQLVFRNHLNQIVMLYTNKANKLVMFNYDNVKGTKLSLGKRLGSKVKEFVVCRHGSSVIEYKLTFEIDKKDFVISNRVTLVNVF
jgi:hypothetical protein